MEYEIVKHQKNFFIRIQVGITKKEYEKLEKVNHKVVEHAKRDLMIDSVTVTSTHVTFVKEFKELGIITNKDVREFEKSISEFFQWLKDYQIPEAEPECPNHDVDEAEAVSVEDLEFVKKMLEDINKPKDNAKHIVGALIADTTTSRICTELTCWGQMSHNLLKAMCELYVKTYDKG